jgi:hypothetical protein
MNLTLKEQQEGNLLKDEFSRVRKEIEFVQTQMDELNFKAGTLLRELENLRDRESDWLKMLNENYGNGSLDPINMVFNPENKKENE